MKEVWTRALGKEFGSLAQGNDLIKTPGTHKLCVLGHEQIKNIKSDQTVTYTIIVVVFFTAAGRFKSSAYHSRGGINCVSK